MKKFATFLKESAESHVVLTFGRFNPPTFGHDLVMRKVYELTETYGAEHHVYLSRSHDASKNPLDPETKLAFVNECWPGANAQLATKEYPGIIQLAEKINGSHTHLHVVAGQDRVQEYQTLLDRYNGKNYNYESITVHSAGDRNPLDEGIEGISASKMREYVKTGNRDAFIWGCPNEATEETCRALFHAVRKGLGIQERGVTFGTALFLTGGPGSGKDVVLRPLVQNGVVELTPYSPRFQSRFESLAENRTPIVINGAYNNPEDFLKIVTLLDDHNYVSAMVYVYTSDHESKLRNESRLGNGRVINEAVRQEKYVKSANMTPLYKEVFGEGNFIVFNNETENNNLPKLMSELTEYFYGEDINPKFENFLAELFQHGYPIVPDDQNPINRNIPTIGKKSKTKQVNPKTFQGTVDRNNSVPGNGIGYDYSIRGAEGSAPASGIGDASYREDAEYNDEELNELFSGEHHYPHTYHFNGATHRYSFKSDAGRHYDVHIHHQDKHAAHVEFESGEHPHDAAYKDSHITGHEGKHAAKVFSTVAHIMKTHARNHPHVKHVEYNSIEPNRTKLYHHISKKLDPKYTHSNDDFGTEFKLSAKKLREDLDSSMSMIGGGGNSEPMVTPGEKVVDQMTATATPPKKKSFRELRNANK